MRLNLMLYTRLWWSLYCSANWKCPKCGKIELWFLVLCSSLVPFVF